MQTNHSPSGSTRPRKTRWQVEYLSIALLIKLTRRGQTSHPLVLIGKKLTGPLKGYLMAPGGHVNARDYEQARQSPLSAKWHRNAALYHCSKRETLAETGLYPSNGVHTADLIVKFIDGRVKLVVHIIKFREWTGNLRRKSYEFKGLRFVRLSRINWKKASPGDEGWMKKVVRNHLNNFGRLTITITCGKDRTDVKSVKIEPLN